MPRSPDSHSRMFLLSAGPQFFFVTGSTKIRVRNCLFRPRYRFVNFDAFILDVAPKPYRLGPHVCSVRELKRVILVVSFAIRVPLMLSALRE
jgi:hypothetical protein